MQIKICTLSNELDQYLKKYRLEKKWQKAKLFLENSLTHPSLNFEKIIFKRTVFYSFRLDKKYRGICIFEKGTIEVVLFTNHYQ